MPIQSSVKPIPFFQLRAVGKAFIARQPHPAWQAPSLGTIYQEFYCDPVNGDNRNAGSDPNGVAKYTSTNGNWDGASTFIPTDGTNPCDSGVVIGDYASVYIDGAVTAVYIARVMAVTNAPNGAIIVSTSGQNIRAGTIPTSSATARTIKIGGAWKGPSGAVNFPFALSSLGFLGSSPPTGPLMLPRLRVNLKNNGIYNVTIGQGGASTSAPLIIQGYSNTPGDGGRATIDGGTTGASYAVFANLSPVGMIYADLIFKHNGATGNNTALQMSTTGPQLLLRITVANMRGVGLQVGGNGMMMIDCEVYGCNTSLTGNTGAIVCSSANCTFVRLYCHDNLGPPSCSAIQNQTSSLFLFDSIIESNSGPAILNTANNFAALFNCDIFNNSGDAVQFASQTQNSFYAENNNLLRNAGYAINNLNIVTNAGEMRNNAYGNRSQANKAGDYRFLGAVSEFNKLVYSPDITPWVAPTTGNFNIDLAVALGAGRGFFSQSDGIKSGTVGYPDIGAAQSDPTLSGLAAIWNNGTFQLPDGYLNYNYLYVFNFGFPVSFNLQSGTLPPGLALLSIISTNAAEIIGTPTAMGDYSFVIRAITATGFGDATFYLTIRDDPNEGAGGVAGG